MQIRVEAIAEASLQVAFATAIDIAAWPAFVSGVQGVELLTPGPIGAGTRFRETRAMFGRTASEEMTVTEIEAPRRFLLTALNHGTAYRVEHRFEAEGAATRLVLVFEGRPVTLAARLLMPLGLLFRGSVRRQLEGDLADLAREAGRRQRGGG